MLAPAKLLGIRLVLTISTALSQWSDLQAQRVDNDTLAFPAALQVGNYQLEAAYSRTQVLTFAKAPNQNDRLYLGERSGTIRIVDNLATGTGPTTPFLNISSRVTTGGENGLLGVAFHPKYATNRQFFVFYTTGIEGGSRVRVSRFLRSVSDPDLADANSEVILINQIDRASNHNGGDIHFGPDGYLYVSVGDEGGANDTYNNGQRIDRDFFAGLLRLDVDKLPSSIEPTAHAAVPRYTGNRAAYSIPADNPIVSTWQNAGSDPNSSLRLEFYAIGLRNAWRFSFDSVTGRLWLADVGQGKLEEVNIIEKGGNYGWALREGSLSGPKSQTPPVPFQTLSDPLYEYSHPGSGAPGPGYGYSITGGVVYRGSRLPELYGAYIFGDYVSGRILALMPNPNGGPPNVTQIATLNAIVAFGVDPSNGDILLSSIGSGVRRLVRGSGQTGLDLPATLSATGAFKNLDTLHPEDGIYAYEPNLSFWSDYAHKRRWVSVPAGKTVGYSEEGAWTAPTGTIWIKHFDLETTRGDPTTRRRIETRFLIKAEHGGYGVSYRWNEAQDEATLAPDEGVSFDLQVTEGGVTRSQTWSIPGRTACLTCHNDPTRIALSFDTRQLNRTNQREDETRNTIAYLSELGILDTAISDNQTAALPRHFAMDDPSATLQQRARSYLAVNCAVCHQPGAVGANTWDARPEISLAATGLVDSIPNDFGDFPQRRLVTYGASKQSILIDRLAARDGFTRMPPLASNELDTQGIALLATWIDMTPWQITHWGDSELSAALPVNDADSDGNSNVFEYLTDTDPLDVSSRWALEYSAAGGSLDLLFPAVDGRTFEIEHSQNLKDWLPGTPPGPQQTPGEPVFLRVKIEKER